MNTEKQKQTTRRERNRELGRMDAAQRCPICRLPFLAVTFQRFGDPNNYCSSDCVQTAIEREAT